MTTTPFTFTPATKHQAKLRLALAGPTGTGKTYSALAIASGLGEKIAVIDTEHGSASLYADRFGFDTLNLASYHPQTYIEAIRAAEAGGYDVLVIDSLSHAWAGKDGSLELVDKARARSQSNNSFTAWKDITPLQNRLVETMLGCAMHLIVTMRSKTEYVIETVNGKQVPRKVGLAPVQRDGIEYEFTVFGELNAEHQLIVTKSRLAELADQVIEKPGTALAEQLVAWLDGDTSAPPAAVTAPPPPEARRPAPSANGSAPAPASADQTKAIHTMLRKLGEEAQFGIYEAVKERWPHAIGDDGQIHSTPLTRAEASALISLLNKELDGAPAR